MIDPEKPDFENTPASSQRAIYDYELQAGHEEPIISIITPFYNTGREFEETARSVFRQSLQQWEWLIVNDGSDNPNALQMLEEYRRKDDRIRVIDHPQNLGLSAARNTGVNQARTDYILFLDSDDLLEPTAAEKWWWFLETHPQYAFVDSYHVAFGGRNYLWRGGFHVGAQNAERNHISMMCMIHKSVHQKVGGFDETIRGGLEDWEFWMRCAAQGYWGDTLPEFLAWYRVRKDHSDHWENLNEDRIIQFRNQLQDRYPDLYQGKFPTLQESLDLDLTPVTLDSPQANLLQKSQPRLLLILPWLVMGGAERFSLNLMDQLNRRGWQISLVTTSPSDNPWYHQFEQRTPDVFVFPNFLPIKDYPRFLRYLIGSRQFDIVILQGSIEGYRLLPILRGLFPKLPILDYLHFVTLDWMDGGFPRLSILYQYEIDMTITSCEHVKRWMMAEGTDENQLRVCPIGVDPTVWKPDAFTREKVRQELGIGEDEALIIYAARLEAQKQPLLFAETLRLLNEQGVSFRAIVAGDGSLRSELEGRIAQFQLNDKVNILGGVKAEDMPEVMASGDLFFLPSQNEGISSAIFEAMSTGLPIVGADIGGQAELVTPECGILVSPSSEQEQAASYAVALSELILDAPRRQRMGVASRERITSGFTLDQMGECMASILTEVMHRKHKGLLKHVPFPPEQHLLRDIRNVVEYLQARQEWRNINERCADLIQRYSELSNRYSELSNRYFEILQPKPPSHWFYLWIRQIFLPFYQRLQDKRVGKAWLDIKEQIKKKLMKG